LRLSLADWRDEARIASLHSQQCLSVCVLDRRHVGDRVHLSPRGGEAALLQFAAMGKVDGLGVKKWGEVFDNSDDQDARWHDVEWIKVRALGGVEEMIRSGEHGALDRHARDTL
jgi:hypothetical protein